MCNQARNLLGPLGGAKSFLRGPNFFKACPIVLNYVQHIFPRGRETETFREVFAPRAVCNAPGD